MRPQESESYLNLTLCHITPHLVCARDQYGDRWVAELKANYTTEAMIVFKDLYNGTPIEEWLPLWHKFLWTWECQYLYANWRDLPWRPV